MSKYGWHGFRVVTKPRGGPKSPGIWHGFKTDRPGSKSLCGRVRFGPQYRSRGGRSCAVCARIWEAEYPPTAKATA